MHFAVPQHVDDGGHLTASAAARAAAGKAASITENASSSMAALTNQASYALGGAYTPASSNAWKNGGKRHVSDALCWSCDRGRRSHCCAHWTWLIPEWSALRGSGRSGASKGRLGGLQLIVKLLDPRL